MLRFAWETSLQMPCEPHWDARCEVPCELPWEPQIARQIRRLLAQATGDCR